jgi:signal transduction histidine kinase
VPADPEQDFAEEWATLLPPVDTRPATLVWHLPIYRPGVPVASPAQRRQACVGAIEAWFDLKGLFAELARQSQGLGLRVAVVPPVVPGKFRKMERIVFMDHFQAVADLNPEGREFDFATTSLSVVLSAAPSTGRSRGLGVAVALFGVLGSLVLSRVVRNRYERRLLESERALDRFAQVMATAELGAAVTHELSQPLTGVLGCLEGVLIRADRGELTAEVARRDLSQALSYAQRACEFIEDVRRQTGQGRTTRAARPVAVAEVLSRVVAMTRLDRRFQPIRIHLRMPDPAHRVLATEIAMECVLLNLLRNSAEAILSAGRGGSIWLGATRDGDQISLRVSDDGPGLSQPHKLFQPFQTTKPRGMGLGLCYCKRTVEGFGGTIQGGNRPEGGACFVIRLPLGEG